MTDDFRCSAASRDDDEPMAGTAPADTAFLFLEHAGAWGRNAIADSRLPEVVRSYLAGLAGTRVQLIRRHGGESGPGVRLFHAVAATEGFTVRTTVLDDVERLPTLDLQHDLADHPGTLWMVCTNGRRDRCCTEVGRPVAAAVAARWHEETWETTHLGGHRFAGTLLALPSGHTLGRLTPDNVAAACADLAAGRVPVELSRGRAGRAPLAQVRELHVLAGGPEDSEILEVPGPPRRQSCADLEVKATTRFEIRRPVVA